MALLGDVVNYDNAEFVVEVTFHGDMAGIVVFGSESSYVMCRLDSAKGEQATGLSIVTHPNNVVVNGKQNNGQLPNPENTPIRLKITIHEDVVTCYSSGFGETSEILPRIYGTYPGTHTGRFGFVTLNAAASFRILGCPNNTPIPDKPPCIPDSDSNSDDNDSDDNDSVSVDNDSVSVDNDSDSDDNDDDDDNDSDDNDGFNIGGDSGDGDSDDKSSSDSRADSSDSSDDPDKGPTCLPKPIVPTGGPSSASDSKESESDSFDVEAAIGVQTHSLSHAVFEDRILYLLASIGIAASLIVMCRLFCMKEDYEAVAEPELEEL